MGGAPHPPPPGGRDRERADQLGILDGRGAEDDALDAELEVRLGGLERADAAADLHARPERGDDGAHDGLLRRAPRARALEIDDVDAWDVPPPAGGDAGRIGIVDRHLIVAALVQPHRLTAEEIDRREDIHRGGG